MKQLILLFGIISFFQNNTYSAVNFEDSLYMHLYQFQILNKELCNGDIKKDDLKKSFYIQELVEGTNTEEVSIYQFYNLLYEEVNTNIFIIKKDKIEIYDTKELNLLISTVIDLPLTGSAEIVNSRKILWIKQLLIINNEIKSQSLDNMVFKKQYGKYFYFFP